MNGTIAIDKKPKVKKVRIGYISDGQKAIRFIKVLCDNFKATISAVVFKDEEGSSTLIFRGNTSLGELLEGAKRCELNTVIFNISYKKEYLYLQFNIKQKRLYYTLDLNTAKYKNEIKKIIKKTKQTEYLRYR